MRRSYHKTICLDFKNPEFYQNLMENPQLYKSYVQQQLASQPELFPGKMQAGFWLNGLTRMSKKRDFA